MTHPVAGRYVDVDQHDGTVFSYRPEHRANRALRQHTAPACFANGTEFGHWPRNRTLPTKGIEQSSSEVHSCISTEGHTLPFITDECVTATKRTDKRGYEHSQQVFTP